MSTIITAFEVISYGPVDDNYPVDSVCTHIKRVELSEFAKCYMGLTFYEEILAKVTDISAARAFVIGTTYNTGDMIIYKGLAWKSKADGNTTHPQNNISLWEKVSKFTDSCLNLLWDNGLKYWLGYAVIYTSIRYNTYKAGAKGLVKTVEDDTGVATVNSKEFSDFKRELLTDTESWLTILYDYMVRITNDKTNECSYSNIEEIGTECGECIVPSKRRKRRFHFKK